MQTHALALKLQETIERKLELDIAGLRDEWSKTILDLKHLKADQQVDRKALQEERDKLREEQAKVKGVSDGLASTNTMMQILEQRLSDNTQNLKATRQNL